MYVTACQDQPRPNPEPRGFLLAPDVVPEDPEAAAAPVTPRRELRRAQTVSSEPAPSPEPLRRTQPPGSCEICDEGDCYIWLKLKSLQADGDAHLVSPIEDGAFICCRCAAIHMLQINYEYESTGILEDCCVLDLSQEANKRRRRSSRDSPEAHRAVMTRSQSWLQDEHLCELCARFLRHFVFIREEPSPGGFDYQATYELCPFCVSKELISCHARGARTAGLVDLYEITRNDSAA